MNTVYLEFSCVGHHTLCLYHWRYNKYMKNSIRYFSIWHLLYADSTYPINFSGGFNDFPPISYKFITNRVLPRISFKQLYFISMYTVANYLLFSQTLKKGGLSEEMVQKCLNQSSTITGYVVIQQIFYFPMHIHHIIYSEFRLFTRGFIYTPQTIHNMGITIWV